MNPRAIVQPEGAGTLPYQGTRSADSLHNDSAWCHSTRPYHCGLHVFGQSAALG